MVFPKNCVLENELPNDARIVDSVFSDYREELPNQSIIRSSPSSGPFSVVFADIFSQKSEENNNPKPLSPQKIHHNYDDPWIQLKSIPNGKIVNKNTIITQENKVLIGLQYHYITPVQKPKEMKNFNIDYFLAPKSNPKLFCPVASETRSYEKAFFLGGTDNFGHWIFEFLPKLLWYKKYLFDSGIDIPIIIDSEIPERWLEVVEALNIPKAKLLKETLGTTLEVEELYICGSSFSKSLDMKTNYVRVQDCVELRTIFREYYKLHLIPKSVDILFETRRNARWRKIINEEHLIDKIKNELKLKVELFYPEIMSFEDQLKLLQKSHCFVGKGASLPISFLWTKTLSYLK